MKKITPIVLVLLLCLSVVACKKVDTYSYWSSGVPHTSQPDTVSSQESVLDEENTNSFVSSLESTITSKPSSVSSPLSSSATKNSSTPKSSTNVSSTVPKPNSTDWKYYNGGIDHIIKTNGVETIKISVPEDWYDYDKIKQGNYENAEGIATSKILRDPIIAYNGWLYFSECNETTWKSKTNSDDFEKMQWETAFYKMREDGTQKTQIGFCGMKSSSSPVAARLIGAIGEYMFFSVFDGNYGRSDEDEDTLCKISMKGNITDLAEQREHIAYIDWYSSCTIDGEWISFTSSGEKYKIKFDGSGLKKIS